MRAAGRVFGLHPPAPFRKQPQRKAQVRVQWGRSSVGRALEWHSRGQEFDPPRLHQLNQAMIGHPPAEDRPFRLRAVPCGTKAQGRAIRLAAAPVHHQARADALDAPLELTGPVPAQGRIMFPCAAYPAGGNGARTAPQGVVGPLKTPISATHTGRHGSLCGGL